MRYLPLGYPLIIILLVNIGCQNSLLLSDEGDREPNAKNGTIIYVNSFESNKDTVGWRGYGTMQFRNDAPAEGGELSIYVSGGCIWPHAYIELEPLKKDSRLVLQCWGRNMAIGGRVSLEIGEEYHDHYIGIAVDDSCWTSYETLDTIFVSAHQKITLTMGAGGIVPSAMLIDLIKVIKLEENS